MIFPFLSLFFLFLQINYAQRMLFDVPDSATLSKKDIPVIKPEIALFHFRISSTTVSGNTGGRRWWICGAFSGYSHQQIPDLRGGENTFDYLFHDKNNRPSTYFVFQFDGNEQGVNIRDFGGGITKINGMCFLGYSRPLWDPWQWTAVIILITRSAETGRMSQILMKGERDLGANHNL